MARYTRFTTSDLQGYLLVKDDNLELVRKNLQLQHVTWKEYAYEKTDDTPRP